MLALAISASEAESSAASPGPDQIDAPSPPSPSAASADSSGALKQESPNEPLPDLAKPCPAVTVATHNDDGGGGDGDGEDYELSVALAQSLAKAEEVSKRLADDNEAASLALAYSLVDNSASARLDKRDANCKIQVVGRYEYDIGRASAASSCDYDESSDGPAYWNNKFSADDAARYSILYGERDAMEQVKEDSIDADVYKLNGNAASNYARSGDTIVNKATGDTVGTKHDLSLMHAKNSDLLRTNAAVSDKVMNQVKSFNKSQQQKGVSATSASSKSSKNNDNVTSEGVLDNNVRIILQKLINTDVLQRVFGIVKEGKEGVIIYSTATDDEGAKKHVAIKVFKRIQEFSNRGDYVTGDSRYAKKSFGDEQKRKRVAIWTLKEFRNLTRAFLAGVVVPRPICVKDNVLCMTFLGFDGWPAPTLKEVVALKIVRQSAMRKYYLEVLVAIKRLYVCAKLVHGDISEYNLILVESKQVREQVASAVDVDYEGPDAMPVGNKRIVLIDFGQAVTVDHPESDFFLSRDVKRANDFFKSVGVSTLEDEEVVDFVKREEAEVVEEAAVDDAYEQVDVQGDVPGDDGDAQDDTQQGAAQDDEGWTTISEEERSEATLNTAASGDDCDTEFDLDSTTTSVLKSNWRFRASALKDGAVYEELSALVGAIEGADLT
jgi:serine/threonine-protein kinase RIO1